MGTEGGSGGIDPYVYVRMRPMRLALRILPLAALAALSLAGCKKSPPADQQMPGVNSGGKPLASPARYIISLSPSATEVLAQNGASRFIFGRTASCNYPKFVTKYPVVMAGTKPDYEKIGKVMTEVNHPGKPDLFVYDPSLFNSSEVAQMAQNSRIPPFALDGDSVDEFIHELTALSSYYTGETFMSAYVDNIQKARRMASADPVKPTPKVALIIPGQGSEHMIAGKDSFYADEIRAATGDPVGPPGDKFVPLNAEWLLQQNPDIIFTAGDRSSFMKDARLQGLSAIKNNRVPIADEDVAERHGARVDEFISQIHDTMAGLMHSGASK